MPISKRKVLNSIFLAPDMKRGGFSAALFCLIVAVSQGAIPGQGLFLGSVLFNVFWRGGDSVEAAIDKMHLAGHAR